MPVYSSESEIKTAMVAQLEILISQDPACIDDLAAAAAAAQAVVEFHLLTSRIINLQNNKSSDKADTKCLNLEIFFQDETLLPSEKIEKLIKFFEDNDKFLNVDFKAPY